MSQIIVYFLLFLLILLKITDHLKMRRIIKALENTNKSLNETRDLVANHHKELKRLYKLLEIVSK